ncbi:MAG: hypothetical protein JRJ12_04570 [Deltaproteobacteria bacterium]|nr:hypothetical protein [Deltaproteobacteria bacterium]MBW2070469.1 hypothetical protein [Deltaproteobacteria bacterium]
MSKWTVIGLIFLGICFITTSATAGDFDGSKPLLFSAIKVFECSPQGSCDEVTAESISLPQFLKIDFKAKKVTPARKTAGKKGSDIQSMKVVDGKLMLQGAEDGVEGVRDGIGWTMAISEETGKAILTASGEEVAFVVFGACTPL